MQQQVKKLNVKEIRKEKAILIDKLKKENHKNPYPEAGKIINEKYGKGWAEKYQPKQSYGYDEWWQEKNMDGSFAYNGVTEDF